MTIMRAPCLVALVCTTCHPLYCLVCNMNSTNNQHVSSPVTFELAMDEREEASMLAGVGKDA